MHRKAGVGSLQEARKQRENFQKIGAEIQTQQTSQLKACLSDFKANLTSFAQKHAKDIKENPEFRQYFNKLVLFFLSVRSSRC